MVGKQKLPGNFSTDILMRFMKENEMKDFYADYLDA